MSIISDKGLATVRGILYALHKIWIKNAEYLGSNNARSGALVEDVRTLFEGMASKW